MLAELAIDNLVLIAEARLELSPGLNVITGETGAGKSLLAQAIGLLMGQRGGAALVRRGAERAFIQALFDEGEESFAVARVVPREGRSRAYNDGLLSSAAVVEEVLRSRLAFYGQLEHTKLLHLDRQLDLLDTAAGLDSLLAEYSAAYADALAATRELEDLHGTEAEHAREADMLRFQIDEITAAELQPGEEVRLTEERERLRHAEKLLERVGGALSLLIGEEEGAAVDAVRVARHLVGEASAFDAGLAALEGRLDGALAELDDLAAELRAYLDDLALDPSRSHVVELRYDEVRSLLRKYGQTTEEVLAYAERSAERLAVLEAFEVDRSALERRVVDAQGAALRRAELLGEARRSRAVSVAARMEEELRGLALPHASFSIAVEARGEGWSALGPRGADDVEFLFSANPGTPLRPLREVASGGELSRTMLALRSIVTLQDDVETIVFDEVDTGIGGVTASALGERLAELARSRQVLCITHLPQIAAFADRHFALAKESDEVKGTTVTVVRRVAGEERLAELCRMLGADRADASARSHAEGLLNRAAERSRAR